MKKIVLTALCVLQVSGMFAQSWKFDVHAGANRSKLAGGDKYTVYDSKNRFGGQVGANACYIFKGGLVLSSGLDLVQSGGKYSTYTFVYNDNAGSPFTEFEEIKSSELSFEVPLKIGWLFHLSRNLDLLPLAGVYGRYSFASDGSSCKLAGSNRNIDIDCHKDEYPDDTHLISAYKKFDFGYNLELKLAVSQHYMFGIGYSRGLTDKSNQYQVKNSDLRFTVGYIF